MADGMNPPIRDAATIVLVRADGPQPRVLMGQRGSGAIFMPDKFVFPGGAVDAGDRDLGAALTLGPDTARRLQAMAPAGLGPALAAAAIRELWEETGLALAAPGPAPEPWRDFASRGITPDAAALRFIFRAVTPAGRPRRFDARFFLADAAALAGDPDDFSLAGDELRHLSWLTLAEARRLELAFITGIVLGEVEAILADPAASRPVPFFHHNDGRSRVLAL